MTTYPFVAAWYDNYGPRKGPTLGLMYHMAEGGGTVGYLDKIGTAPARGVSVHAVCEYSGRVVQMLKWGDASGSLNPADRSTDKAYFSHSTLVDVLGDWWLDPNSAVISMEIEGVAVDGPNAKQVAAAIAWGLDMRVRWPDIRGALGHADQTDTKRCPGATPPMRAIFAGVGGHGLFTEEFPMIPVATNGPFLVELVAGVQLYDQAFTPLVKVSVAQSADGFFSTGSVNGVDYYGIEVVTGGQRQLAFVRTSEAAATPDVPAPLPPDAVSCKPLVDAAVAADRLKAKVVWG